MSNILIRFFVSTLFVALFVTADNRNVDAFKSSDTGHTNYNEGGRHCAEALCAEDMQEAENNVKPGSFTFNDDNTLTDDNTGLMWQQQDDGNTYTWYQASGTYDEMYNPALENVCGNLVLSGYTDWRLPTKDELISIVDYAIPSPNKTIKTTYFPDTKSSGYWSSTTYANYPGYAWAVYFYDGGVYSSSKYFDVYVRCVRGGQSSPAKDLARTAKVR
jgi:hypothetical protein